MNGNRAGLLALCFLMGVLILAAGPRGNVAAEEKTKKSVVYLLDISGSVNPALSDYLIKGIERGEEENAAAVIIRMDTPGGLVSTTKTIIKKMLNSRVPVVVYVAPGGSSASSAGALITMGADVAAMAPSTNIGAAHPVGGGGEEIPSTMAEKQVNDLTAYMRGVVTKRGRNADWCTLAIKESVSITSEEALAINVIDLVAESVPELLKKLDGRKVTKEQVTVTLQTANARVERIQPGLRFKILDVVANPNVAYFLMMIGALGLMAELYHPGMIFPGVLGAMCLLLAFFALQVLPVNYVGIMLMVLAVILFILELKVHSLGLLSIAAVICLTLGSIMLFETEESAMRVSWTVILPTVATVSAFFIFCLGLVVRAQLGKPRTGSEGLIGEVGVALTDLDGEGKVSVQGTYWTARADSRIPRGERIRVTRIDGLTLSVTRDAGSAL